MIYGDDPIQAEVHSILAALAEGTAIDHAVERQYVDLKEEHGRRDRQGNIGPSNPRNQEAAQELAAAAACMANTPRWRCLDRRGFERRPIGRDASGRRVVAAPIMGALEQGTDRRHHSP